jgi:hypothetical protein
MIIKYLTRFTKNFQLKVRIFENGDMGSFLVQVQGAESFLINPLS